MDALGRARNDEEKPARAAEADVMLQRMSSGHLHGNAHQHTSSLEKDALEALALFGRRQSNDHPGEQASFEFALSSALASRQISKQELQEYLAEFESNPMANPDLLVEKLGSSGITVRDMLSERQRARSFEGRVPESLPPGEGLGKGATRKRSLTPTANEEEDAPKRRRALSEEHQPDGSLNKDDEDDYSVEKSEGNIDEEADAYDRKSQFRAQSHTVEGKPHQKAAFHKQDDEPDIKPTRKTVPSDNHVSATAAEACESPEHRLLPTTSTAVSDIYDSESVPEASTSTLNHAEDVSEPQEYTYVYSSLLPNDLLSAQFQKDPFPTQVEMDEIQDDENDYGSTTPEESEDGIPEAGNPPSVQISKGDDLDEGDAGMTFYSSARKTPGSASPTTPLSWLLAAAENVASEDEQQKPSRNDASFLALPLDSQAGRTARPLTYFPSVPVHVPWDDSMANRNSFLEMRYASSDIRH
ncbi:MAG: hypothetical protein CYPHOPRED_004227 [Cyphobasidiales sp. Tagirdzhanova-0007]|nr:MAG: hypothetical protein CYPHOPRED_004227 [Cyphobasidiales sp. Tagirdzhanova-0007]